MNPFKPKPPGKPQRTGTHRANPTAKPDEPINTTGRVTFDDRGQAVWEWSIAKGRFEKENTNTSLKKLTDVELSLVDDPLPADPKKVQVNASGIKKGYDPYDSGRLSRAGKRTSVKKDLRKLAEWIDLKKSAERNKKGD